MPGRLSTWTWSGAKKDRKLLFVAEERHYRADEAEEILRLAARKETDTIPRDRLIQMAAELGMSPEQVTRAEQEYLAKRDAEIERKKFEAHVLRDLWSHVATYVAVNGGLVLMDVVKDGQVDWAFWPLLGWGIGLACHIASVFWSSSDEEDRSFREWRANWERRPLTMEECHILDEFVPHHPGQKLLAIKELRDRLGIGLREAKDAVDQYAELNPAAFDGIGR